MRRARGFTLTELMVVIVIFSVLTGVAVKSFRKSHSEADIDRWTATLQATVTEARRRAVSTGTPYMIDVRPTNVRWCQIDPSTITLLPTPSTSQTACPAGAVTTYEVAPPISAPPDAQTSLYAPTADILLPGGTYTAATRTTIGTGLPFYFGPNGTCDTTFAKVMSGGASLTGFTLYVRRQGADEVNKRRRLVVYGLSARPRVIDNY